ncbi:hypothetical protein FGG08_001727 [Glutinoglossum americanum]|uniref:Uncharacterized protein n=1 Tax=Glutinoglossum americanum TaxID=1670608 RepID=A0A9P8IAQ4_9PEZI|nr:hypothetical protein FGG08_001727 [Glutinoglossum americanum]
MMLLVLLSSPLFLSLITSERAFALAQLGVKGGHITLSSAASSESSASSTGLDGAASVSTTSASPLGATNTAVVGSPLLFIGSTPSATLVSTTTSHSNPASTSTYLASTPAPSSQQSMSSVQRRNLILILALGLGSVLVAVAAWLSYRLRRRRSSGASFFGRNSTPIDDEEIQTWRKQASVASTVGSHNAERKPRFSMEWAEKLPTTPPTAKAPNARMGLTDEIVPGEEPFVPLPKRSPSSRIYRPRHLRSKSARSSISDRPPTPFAVEESKEVVPLPPRMPGVPGNESQPGDH